MTTHDWTFETQLVHNAFKTDRSTGAVSVPIQHASTFHQSGFDDFGQYDYSRSGTPTRQALEDTIAALEGGTRGLAFASGMAYHLNCFSSIIKRRSRPCHKRCVWRYFQNDYSSSFAIWH